MIGCGCIFTCILLRNAHAQNGPRPGGKRPHTSYQAVLDNGSLSVLQTEFACAQVTSRYDDDDDDDDDDVHLCRSEMVNKQRNDCISAVSFSFFTCKKIHLHIKCNCKL